MKRTGGRRRGGTAPPGPATPGERVESAEQERGWPAAGPEPEDPVQDEPSAERPVEVQGGPAGPPGHRSGWVAIAGRPNVGKSTLLNHLLGQKVSIVSRRPQTTRNRILGIYSREDLQVLFLDTPGLHDAQDVLGRRMVDEATSAIGQAEMVLLLVDPVRQPDPAADAGMLRRLASGGRRIILVPNKIDLVPKERLLPLIDAWSRAASFEAIVPICARSGDGVGRLMDEVAARLPEGPAWFPDDEVTDVSLRFLVSELVREAAFFFLDKELPYALAVEVEEWQEKRTLTRILARIWVEREGQKAIVIGHKGQMLVRIGTSARGQIERLLGTRVYLALTVGVDPDWTRHGRSVQRLGHFEQQEG